MARRRGIGWWGAGAILALCSPIAHAGEPPPKLRTKFETTASPATMASLACALDARTVVETRMRAIDIQVVGGCASPSHDDALHAVLTVSADEPASVVMELEVPEGISPGGLEELKGTLRDVASELRRRASIATAIPKPERPIRGAFPVSVSARRTRTAVCALNATSRVDGQTRPIGITVEEDGALEACSDTTRNAVHVIVHITSEGRDRWNRMPQSAQIVVEIIATKETAAAVEDLRKLLPELGSTLQNRSGTEWSTRAGMTALVELGQHAAPPEPRPTVPATTEPTFEPRGHRVVGTNWDLVNAGLALTLGGYAASLLMGAAVSNNSAQGSSAATACPPTFVQCQKSGSGNWPYWPFVPFVGAFAFSVSYRDSSDFGDSGAAFSRVFAVATGIIIDGAQLVGVGLMIGGVALPKARFVKDAVLRPSGNGFVLEGRF